MKFFMISTPSAQNGEKPPTPEVMAEMERFIIVGAGLGEIRQIMD